ncbi:hypothetical protein [Nocardia miyunensis]|uniref:hypothetical protein n=1 Tax=Nocardia miyunensis TaxID=282684 RepID=UPI000B092A94
MPGTNRQPDVRGNIHASRAYSDRAEPVELSVGYFLPDQYTYRTNLLRHSGERP